MIIQLITMFLFIYFRRIAHCRKSYNLWLVYDIFLHWQKTRYAQTVLPAQKNAPTD